MVVLISIGHILLSLAVISACGLWLSYIDKSRSILRNILISIFGGLGTIGLVIQFFYYLTDSFSLSVLPLLPLVVTGLYFVVRSIWKKEIVMDIKEFMPLVFAIPGIILVNYSFLTVGVSDYAGARNPDMWYYAAQTKKIMASDTTYLEYGGGLRLAVNAIASSNESIAEFLDEGNTIHIDVLREAIIEKYIGDKYYYYPGKTPLITGVTTRNGTEFIASYLAWLQGLDGRVVYSLLHALYPVLAAMAVLWMTMLFKISRSSSCLAVLLVTISSSIYSTIYTQWPGTAIGIPIIVFLFGYFYSHLTSPTWNSGFVLALLAVAALSIYPEGLVITVIPVFAMLGFELMRNSANVLTAFRKSVFWFVLLFFTIGFPALVLSVFRLSKISGKYVAMPGPPYSMLPSVIYTMWIQPHWIQANVLSISKLWLALAGSMTTITVFILPFFVKVKNSYIVQSFIVGFVAIFLYLYVVRSPYAIDKLFHYYPLLFAIAIAATWDYIRENSRKFLTVVCAAGIACYLTINMVSVRNLAIIDADSYRMAYLPDRHIPGKAYSDLGHIDDIVGKNEKLLLVLPDQTSQLWATHYIDNPVVMADGINYLDNFVKSAFVMEGDGYLSNYNYMLIPGPDYPTIEDYSELRRGAVWQNQLFSVVKKSHVYFLSENISTNQSAPNNFYQVESSPDRGTSSDSSLDIFRWFNKSVSLEYLNFDHSPADEYALTAECQSPTNGTLQLELLINGIPVETLIFQDRETKTSGPIFLDSTNGYIELRNTNLEGIRFPGDARDISFRCFGIRFGRAGLIQGE